jgi:hypothetical protein
LPAAKNLAGILESGSRDHYRAREKHRKRETQGKLTGDENVGKDESGTMHGSGWRQR